MFEMIAFDADDTLWHNEVLYTTTQDRFKELLNGYLDTATIEQELYETEKRNLKLFGYGIKAFTLSMIETAIELTGGQIEGKDVQVIIDFAKEMLTTPVRLLEQAEDVVSQLANTHRLMLITKGDLFDQETKIARSGLADYFEYIEVVSEKSAEIYREILAKQEIEPQRFLMVGNSLRSDVLPVAAIGGMAVHIPYHTTWVHETVAGQEAANHHYHELQHIGQLPSLITSLSQ